MTTAAPGDDATVPLVDITRRELERGSLLIQRCRRDGSTWLPVATHCPHCLQQDWSWERASGHGRLISWVVYHYAPIPDLADDLPYQVSLVALDEGPRLITRILDLPDDLPSDSARFLRDAPVRLEVSTDGRTTLPTFRLVEPYPTPPAS